VLVLVVVNQWMIYSCVSSVDRGGFWGRPWALMLGIRGIVADEISIDECML